MINQSQNLTAFLGYIHSLKGYNLSSNLKFKSFSTKNSNSNSNKPLAIKIYDNIHTIETQLKIKKDNNQKSGIYCIINKINGKMYIGSAITNRINTRFRNHCINLTGSIPVKNAINKYGLSNFKFLILEYYPGIIKKENLKKSHIKLIELETYYITIYKPLYNILPYAYSSLGYKHKPETIENLKLNYSEERKLNIGNLNRNKIFTEEEKLKLRNLMLKKYATQPNLKLRLSQAASKPVIQYNLDGTIHSKFSGIRKMAKALNCCHKTINKSILNKNIFKNIGYIKYDLLKNTNTDEFKTDK